MWLVLYGRHCILFYSTVINLLFFPKCCWVFTPWNYMELINRINSMSYKRNINNMPYKRIAVKPCFLLIHMQFFVSCIYTRVCCYYIHKHDFDRIIAHLLSDILINENQKDCRHVAVEIWILLRSWIYFYFSKTQGIFLHGKKTYTYQP